VYADYGLEDIKIAGNILANAHYRTRVDEDDCTEDIDCVREVLLGIKRSLMKTLYPDQVTTNVDESKFSANTLSGDNLDT
jgi:hypothetical protein